VGTRSERTDGARPGAGSRGGLPRGEELCIEVSILLGDPGEDVAQAPDPACLDLYRRSRKTGRPR
jgi:hypothetical protein